MPFSNARVLAERASGILTWKQYGATGDGITDDIAAINACMLAADAGGYEVDPGVPAAEYLITQPINIYDGTRLRGRGKGVTVVKAQRCHGFEMADSTDAMTGFTADFDISGLTVIGDDDTQSSDSDDYIGLWLRRTTRYVISNVEIYGFTHDCRVDGKKNTSGDTFGNVGGTFIECDFETDNTHQQVNSNNNYPGYLFEVTAEDDGTGGADGIALYNCRFYGEILVDTAYASGDGSTTSLTPAWSGGAGIKASKVVTADGHVKVEYVSSAGGTLSTLTVADGYSIDRATDPNRPVFDFASGSAPLGAPAAVSLASPTGDGSTKNFRLSARPTFASTDGGRAVVATVAAAAQTGGTDYAIYDGNNRSFTFATSAVDTAADTVTLSATQVNSLNISNDIGGAGVGRIVRFTTTGVLPAGLSGGTDYYLTEITSTTVKVSASYADAVAGTPTVVNITDVGSGTHTIVGQSGIEFATAPANLAAVVVNDTNLRFSWIDPNADACIKLCPGAQRVGFFSPLIGGGAYGIDFDDARRCLVVDAYFQICGYAVRFGLDAGQNLMPGFSARTDATLLFGFSLDESTDEDNAFNEFLGKGTTVRDFLHLKETYTEADADASRIRKLNGQLQLDALAASGSVRLGVGGNTMFIVNGSADRTSIHNAAGSERWRSDTDGNLTPRNTSGTQDIGDASHLIDKLFANALSLASGALSLSTGSGTPESAVTAPVGSLFLRTDGGSSTTLYIKESGTGNTGWAAK